MSSLALNFKPAVHKDIEQAPFKLPEHFTAVSAQKGSTPDPASHERLRSQLKDAGYVGLEVDGHYGYKEPSMLVIHHGTDLDKKRIEKIAFDHHQQDSVLHSSNLKNEMVYSDGKREQGNGIEWGDHIKSHYTELSGGHKFQLKLGKSLGKSEIRKPRHYGLQDGIHIFHALNDEHRKYMKGIHVDSPTDQELDAAVKKAKTDKMAAVVISGAPPEKWSVKHSDLSGPALVKGDLAKEVRSPRKGHTLGQLRALKENNWHNPDTGTEMSEGEGEEHLQRLEQNKADKVVSSKLKALQGGKAERPRLISEDFFGEMPKKVAKSELSKAFLQPDGITQTDQKTHAAALQSMPENLREWANTQLVPLKTDDVTTLHFHGAEIHVRKLDRDLYSGWVTIKNEKAHSFERVTMPELMGQLQSKLELYETVKAPSADVGQKLEELKAKVSLPVEDDIAARTQRFQAAVNKNFGHLLTDAGQVSIPMKDLAAGMKDPEEECPACENPSSRCSCYFNLPRPRVEFDGKKVTIFFKSESWDAATQEAFVDDLKRRAGQILKRKTGPGSV
jgi:hypothetical protein